MPKKEFKTLGFRIYLFEGGTVDQEARGTLVFFGNGETEIGRKMFNHWDEISNGMRKLIREAGYKKQWKDDHWEFEKKVRI